MSCARLFSRHSALCQERKSRKAVIFIYSPLSLCRFSYNMWTAVTFLCPASGTSQYSGYSSSAQNSPIGHDHTHVPGNCPFCHQQPEHFSASRPNLPGTQEVENTTRVILSPEALTLAGDPKTGTRSPTAQNQTEQTGENASQDQSSLVEPAAGAIPSAQQAEQHSGQSGPDGLTEEEQRQVEELKQCDRAVRAHEQAHLAAAGQYARGGPSFSYQRGPDGGQYAVGGEVRIDLSPVPGDPLATIQKVLSIQRAALAPADPSSADRQIAARAAAMTAQACQELSQQGQESDAANIPPPQARNADLAKVSSTEPTSAQSAENLSIIDKKHPLPWLPIYSGIPNIHLQASSPSSASLPNGCRDAHRPTPHKSGKLFALSLGWQEILFRKRSWVMQQQKVTTAKDQNVKWPNFYPLCTYGTGRTGPPRLGTLGWRGDVWESGLKGGPHDILHTLTRTDVEWPLAQPPHAPPTTKRGCTSSARRA